MANEGDLGNEEMEKDLERSIAACRGDIPEGRSGECELCGEWFGRLIGGACVECREKFGLD